MARDNWRQMESKICTKCGEDKPIEEYNWKGGGRRRSECKACWSIYIGSHYRANRQYYLDKSRRGRNEDME